MNDTSGETDQDRSEVTAGRAQPEEEEAPRRVLSGMLLSTLRPYRRTLLLVLVAQAIQALASLYLPTVNGAVIDQGVVPGDNGYILSRGGIMLGVTLVQIAAAATATYFGARTALAAGRDLRAATFRRVQTFSAREMDRFGAASLITRTTIDVQQLQLLVLMTLILALMAPLTAIGGLTLALNQDVVLSGVLLVAIPALIVVVSLVIRALIPASREMQARIDVVNRILREKITGVRVIRAFVRDHFEQQRFAGANTDLTAVALRMGRLTAYFGASAMLISNLSLVAVVWLGGRRIADGAMEPGALIAFVGYVTLTLTAVMMGMSVIGQAPRARVSAERIDEVLRTEPSITDPAVPVTAFPGDPASPGSPDGNGTVGRRLAFHNVSFSYPGADEPALSDIDFAAAAGRATAVIGSTGSGKTTLVSLIARMYDVTGGSVTLDGVDVRDLDRHLLTRTVGLIPQKAHLFTGSVADNLRWGAPDATDAQLWHALEVAQARDFVATMPDQLDTWIGQGGMTVSGGQRQRLAIARTLTARPAIYVFDDALSALDTSTDAALRAALSREISGATQLVISQRVSTVKDADRIVVLDAGRITGVGTHDELLERDETYREIARSQLSDPTAAATALQEVT